MAQCTTTVWQGDSPYLILTVTESSSSTASTAVLNWKLQYYSKYPPSTKVLKNWAVNINGSQIGSGSYDINKKTGTYNISSGTVSIARGSSAKSIPFSVSMGWRLTWSGEYRDTTSGSGSISINPVTTYTVSYNANGGSGAPGAQTKTHGTNLTLSSTKPTKTGYTFKGWCKTSSANVVDYAPGATYSTNASIILYACWDPLRYNVTFNANGGSGAPSTQQKVYGTNLTLSSTTPTRTGYNFIGWGESSASTTATYQPGGTYSQNAGITLYAIWSANTYQITYNANGGSNAPSAQTKVYNQTLKLSTQIPIREDYEFLGWGLSSNASSAIYGAGGNYTANEGATLYAIWVQIETATMQTIMARYQNPNGTYAGYSQVFSAMLDEGESFGWSSAQTAEYEGVSVSYIAGDSESIQYVDVPRRQYSIRFHANGGLGMVSDQKFLYNSNLRLTNRRPTRSGYKFLGWALNPNATEPDYVQGDYFDSTNRNNPLLYAIWTKMYAENISFYEDGRCEAIEFIEDDYLALENGLVSNGLSELYISTTDIENISDLVDRALILMGGK